MNIYGQKVMLRAMEPDDMELLLGTINDPEIEMMVGGWCFPTSHYTQMQWYEQAINDKDNQRYMIVSLDTNETIGMTNLLNIDWKNRVAFEGIKLIKDENVRGKGYALDAIMALQWYAFEQLQMNRIDGSFLEYNLSSQKVYEKCGMKIEGTKRQAIYKNGKYYDQFYAGILKDEYFEAKERLGWKPGKPNLTK